MTILLEKKLEENVSIKLFEAPVHLSNSDDRKKWQYKEIPFFDENIAKFWQLYSKPFSNNDFVYLSEQEEGLERRRFIEQPIIIGTKLEGNTEKVFGGVWQEVLKPKTIQTHIKVLREERKYAQDILNFYKNNGIIKNKYNRIGILWGKRDKEDDPTQFLARNGFEIKNNSHYSAAFLNLQ